MQTTTIRELVVAIVFILINVNLVSSVFEGEQCFHPKRNVNGICKALESCPPAIDDLKSGTFPERCGFQGKKVIVCCPQATTTKAPPTPTPSPPVVTASRVGEKSRKACKSYEYLGQTVVFGPLNNEIKESICPWSAGWIIIIGGEKAHVGEFPHMALIGYGTLPDNYAWKCGGTLISDKFVLTAAHCLFARGFGEPKFVRLGDLNYTDPKDDQHLQQINIKQFHRHPDYKFPVNYHDIALLELEKPVKLSLYVKPACLYLEDPKSDLHRAAVTGWGITEDAAPSEHLLKATVDFYEYQVCNRTFGDSKRTLPYGIDSNIQICFGSNEDKVKDSCQGDSGGPIQVESRIASCSYDVFGITSFGKKCGIKNVPAGYVKIYQYIDWIEKIVWP